MTAADERAQQAWEQFYESTGAIPGWMQVHLSDETVEQMRRAFILGWPGEQRDEDDGWWAHHAAFTGTLAEATR